MSPRQQEERRLDLRCAELEMILRRREFYVEMIDWEAMTKEDREWARCGHTEEIHLELAEIDDQLYSIDIERWGPW